MEIFEVQKSWQDGVEVNSKTFRKKRFRSEGTVSGNFRNCRFIECEFRDISGFFLGFESCEFIDCFIDNVNFSHTVFNWNNNYFDHCNIRRVNFDEGDMSNVIFENTWFRDLTMGGMFPMDNVQFVGCTLQGADFGNVCAGSADEFGKDDVCLLFENSSLDFVYFNRAELRNVKFIDCRIVESYLMNCFISKETFKTTKTFEVQEGKYISMNTNLTTLKNSLHLDREYLKKFLGISDPRLFDVALHFQTQPAFHTIFISYSFKDAKLARIIYNFMKAKKISCFLWQEDAPGGKYLEHIMASEIKKRSKIVFIASQYSLKSEACQFELSEGRRKQAVSWDEVFVPVFLDRYLFEVEEYQVRPKDKAVEYWQNISELRRINCIDGTDIGSVKGKKLMLENILHAVTLGMK